MAKLLVTIRGAQGAGKTNLAEAIKTLIRTSSVVAASVTIVEERSQLPNAKRNFDIVIVTEQGPVL